MSIYSASFLILESIPGVLILIIIVGKNDLRVPPSQGYQFFHSLKVDWLYICHCVIKCRCRNVSVILSVHVEMWRCFVSVEISKYRCSFVRAGHVEKKNIFGMFPPVVLLPDF